jgi:hypothetical protein
MAAVLQRQAQRTGFLFDFVADFPRCTIDSFLTSRPISAQLSNNQFWWVLLLFDTMIYFACRTRYGGVMLRRATRINPVSKGRFGAGESCAIV